MPYSTFQLKYRSKEINMRTVKRCVALTRGVPLHLQGGWKLANKLDAAKCVRSWSENGGCCFSHSPVAATGSRSKVRFVRQNIIYVPPGGRAYTEINIERRVISLRGNLIFFVCAEPAANCFHISIHTPTRAIDLWPWNTRKWKCMTTNARRVSARIKIWRRRCELFVYAQQVTYIWLGGAGVIYTHHCKRNRVLTQTCVIKTINFTSRLRAWEENMCFG